MCGLARTLHQRLFDLRISRVSFGVRSQIRGLLPLQTALAAPSPVFLPLARTCSLHHGRRYAFNHARGVRAHSPAEPIFMRGTGPSRSPAGPIFMRGTGPSRSPAGPIFMRGASPSRSPAEGSSRARANGKNPQANRDPWCNMRASSKG